MPRVPGVPKVPTASSKSLEWASRWFDHGTITRVFEPLIADWQREWQDAAPASRARITARGLTAFLCAVIVSSPQIVLTAAPRNVTDRVAISMTRFTAFASLLGVVPYAMDMQSTGWRGVLLLFIVPSAITAVFPFSMIGAVDAIRRHEPLPSHVERALVAKLAVVAVLFMIVFGGWVVPHANQAFRRGATPQGPVPGMRELTTLQLLTDPTLLAEHEPFTGGADRATRIQRELNNRAALMIAPVFLLWLRWRSIETASKRWWSPLPTSLAAILSFVVFMTAFFSGWWLEHRFHLSPGIGYWLPIVVIVLWGAATDHLMPRRAAA